MNGQIGDIAVVLAWPGLSQNWCGYLPFVLIALGAGSASMCGKSPGKTTSEHCQLAEASLGTARCHREPEQGDRSWRLALLCPLALVSDLADVR